MSAPARSIRRAPCCRRTSGHCGRSPRPPRLGGAPHGLEREEPLLGRCPPEELAVAGREVGGADKARGAGDWRRVAPVIDAHVPECLTRRGAPPSYGGPPAEPDDRH